MINDHTVLSARRASRRCPVLALAVLALTIAMVVQAPLAHAYLPQSDLIQTTYTKWLEIMNSNTQLWYANFANQLPGPDGITGPDATPDGRGAFLFFRGTGGAPGAIYTNRLSATPQAYGIYGAILAAWSARGHETGMGYPITDERTKGAAQSAPGCLPEDRIQLFSRSRNVTPLLIWACWNPGTGVTWRDVLGNVVP